MQHRNDFITYLFASTVTSTLQWKGEWPWKAGATRHTQFWQVPAGPMVRHSQFHWVDSDRPGHMPTDWPQFARGLLRFLRRHHWALLCTHPLRYVLWPGPLVLVSVAQPQAVERALTRETKLGLSSQSALWWDVALHVCFLMCEMMRVMQLEGRGGGVMWSATVRSLHPQRISEKLARWADMAFAKRRQVEDRRAGIVQGTVVWVGMQASGMALGGGRFLV